MGHGAMGSFESFDGPMINGINFIFNGEVPFTVSIGKNSENIVLCTFCSILLI